MSDRSAELDCQRALERLFVYIDNEMGQVDCVQLRRHLAACAPCLEQYRLECTVKDLIAHSCCEQAPPQLRDRVLGSIRQVPPFAGGLDPLPSEFR